MAYDNTKLNLISQGIGGVGKVFHYASADATTVVGGSSYFTDGSEYGMDASTNDVVIVQDNDNANDLDIFPVEADTVGGAADLGTAI